MSSLFRPADESAFSLLRRIGTPPLRSRVDLLDGSRGGVPLGSIVDIAGSSGTGKTELLMYICSAALLETAENGGPAQRCIWIDLDRKFSIRRFARVLQRCAGGREGALEAALGRLDVARVDSGRDLSCALEVVMQEHRTDRICVFIDGLGPLFWQDKAAQEVVGEAATMMPSVLRFAARVASSRDAILFTTTPVLFSGSKEFAPKAWLSAITHRLRLDHLEKSESKWGDRCPVKRASVMTAPQLPMRSTGLFRIGDDGVQWEGVAAAHHAPSGSGTFPEN